jgi:hypothetical protein
MVNVAMGCSKDRWKMPNAAWFEVAEEEEVFFMMWPWPRMNWKTQRRRST